MSLNIFSFDNGNYQPIGNYITGLTGNVTGSGPGLAVTSINSTVVTGKLLTNFVSGAGTVAATDTILQGFNKLDGNVALKAALASPAFTGSWSGTGVLTLTNAAQAGQLVLQPTAGTFDGGVVVYKNPAASGRKNWAVGGNFLSTNSFDIVPSASTDGTDFNTPAIQIATSGNIKANTGSILINTAGKGLQIKEGSNATMGTATLNGTTEVTVSTTAVTASSRIFVTIQAPGGTPSGAVYVSSRSAGTSFGLKTIALDTSTVAWLIVEPL